MDTFLFSVNAVIPLFLMTLLGWCLTKLKFWNDEFLKIGNSLSFTVFIPAMLFYNIYTSDFSAVFDLKLLAIIVATVILICAAGLLTVSCIVPERARRGVIVQALFRGNTALLGIPLCESLMGAEGAQIASIFLAFIIPTFNILATILLSIYSNDPIESPLSILKKIIRNPLIIGCLSGIAFSLLKIPLPEIILKPVHDLKVIATPFALLILGGDFKFSSFVSNLRCVILTGFSRLVAVPAIAVVIAALFGYRGIHIALVLSTFATPVAVSSTAMTYKMNGDYDLACQLVVFTTIFSAFTLTLFTFVLKTIGLI